MGADGRGKARDGLWECSDGLAVISALLPDPACDYSPPHRSALLAVCLCLSSARLLQAARHSISGIFRNSRRTLPLYGLFWLCEARSVARLSVVRIFFHRSRRGVKPQKSEKRGAICGFRQGSNRFDVREGEPCNTPSWIHAGDYHVRLVND